MTFLNKLGRSILDIILLSFLIMSAMNTATAAQILQTWTGSWSGHTIGSNDGAFGAGYFSIQVTFDNTSHEYTLDGTSFDASDRDQIYSYYTDATLVGPSLMEQISLPEGYTKQTRNDDYIDLLAYMYQPSIYPNDPSYLTSLIYEDEWFSRNSLPREGGYQNTFFARAIGGPLGVTGLRYEILTSDVTTDVSPVPIIAAFPLFGSALGIFSLIGLRQRRINRGGKLDSQANDLR